MNQSKQQILNPNWLQGNQRCTFLSKNILLWFWSNFR